MCGIAGYYGFGDDRELLGAMNQCIVHRGPDGEGIDTGDGVGLAHRRLSIIDVAHGQEPMYSADGQVVLVYNGEVYNYLDLRAELEALGRTFSTVSDTEVVLQAYEQWGDDAFDRFNGMFGFAIHDKRNHRLVLVRDADTTEGYALAIFTTDTTATPEQVVSRYADRWSIEVANATGKQLLGIGQARNRVARAVERTVPFEFLIQTLALPVDPESLTYPTRHPDSPPLEGSTGQRL